MTDQCFRRAATAALAIAACALAAIASGQAAPSFDEVAALFEQHCVACHQGDNAPLDLRLTSHQALMEGSQRGPVVRPGDAEGSELVRRLEGTSQPRMPLTGPPFLDEEEIALVAAWVAAGAPGPAAEQEDGTEVERDDETDPTGDASGSADPFAEIAAILAANCVRCHAPSGLMGPPPEGLMLTEYAQVLAGGERTVVVPGAPLASELYRRVAGLARPRMPLDGPPYLDDAEVERIRSWIARGAPGPGGPAAVEPGARVRLHGTLTGRWELDGLPLVTSDGTRFDDRPAVGDFVEVRGTVTPAGEVRATRIRPR